MKRALRLGLGLGVSGLLLWVAFRDVDFGLVMARLGDIRLGYVGLFAMSLAMIQLCRIFRWGVLIKPFAKISSGALFRISSVGLLLILVMPLRLGEFSRPFLLKRECGASMSAGLATVAVERAIDGLLVTLLFFVTTLALPARFGVPEPVTVAAYASLALFGTAALVIVATLIWGAKVSALLHRLGDPLARGLTTKAVDLLEKFVGGLQALPDARAVAAVVAYTLAYWAANGLGYYAVVEAFGWDIPVVAGFVLVCIVVLGIMIPAGPGHLGTFQAAILIGLGMFGIGASDATAYGIVVYVLTVVSHAAFALPFLMSGRVELRGLGRAPEEAEGSAQAG